MRIPVLLVCLLSCSVNAQTIHYKEILKQQGEAPRVIIDTTYKIGESSQTIDSLVTIRENRFSSGKELWLVISDSLLYREESHVWYKSEDLNKYEYWTNTVDSSINFQWEVSSYIIIEKSLYSMEYDSTVSKAAIEFEREQSTISYYQIIFDSTTCWSRTIENGTNIPKQDFIIVKKDTIYKYINFNDSLII